MMIFELQAVGAAVGHGQTVRDAAQAPAFRLERWFRAGDIFNAARCGEDPHPSGKDPITMDDYPLIADHGLIGDLQTAALVATDGSIDWFCAPRFDSPSIFGALLDHRGGGHFRVRPTVEAFTGKQLYFPDTAALVTRFMTETGVGELVDFMPVTSSRCPPRPPHAGP